MIDLITVCIVNYNSSDFVLNSLYCLQKLTKNSYKVLIRDNNSILDDYLNLKNNINIYSNVELYRIENFNYTGAIAHGLAINDLISKVNSKYGVILDADCTFLHKYWDQILIDHISDKYPIIGTQAPTILGSKKKDDFPLMFAILFDTDILKKLQIDFTPSNDPNNYKDTGEKLREQFLQKGYNGKLINYKSTRFYRSGPFRNVICAEYYLNGYENIFCSHFGRGSTLGINKYLNTRKRIFYNIPVIGRYFLKLKGLSEKKKWIEICHKLVDLVE